MGVVRKLSDYRPPMEVVERRVADTDDGFIMLAMELYEELIGANLTKNQAKVAHAVCRKTYGFKKKMDRIADSQLATLCRISREKVCTARNELMEMKVILSDGRKIGPNKNISEWKVPVSTRIGNIVTKKDTKTVTELVTPSVTELDTHKRNTLKIKENTPLTPQGGEELSQECLDYYNELTGSRCSATAPFEKALSTVKAKGACYSVDEVKLVVRWVNAVWKHKAKPENIFRMTRFNGYLSDALIWESGAGRNPEPCPHNTLIDLWNSKFPTKAIASQEWNRRRPAYGNLEAVWNGKTNSGNWREAKHIGTAFDLISKSTLFSDADNKPWLTLDWILSPKNWGQVYEQAINEHKLKRGMQ